MDDDNGVVLAGHPAGRPDETFSFEIELDTASPLVTLHDAAQLHGRFRHFHSEPIEFQPGVQSALNLGVRVYAADRETQVFEHRMLPTARPIEPGVWTSVSVHIPRQVINFRDHFVIVTDMVKEFEYWFASRGHSPVEAEVTFADGVPGREALAAHGAGSHLPVRIGGAQVSANAARDNAASVHLVFDVSDLIHYFQNARLPTGIQRVQIEVITNLIFSLPADVSLQIGCFTKQTDTWIELPSLFFNHICKLSLINGDPTAGDWQRVLEELRLQTEQAKRLVFRRGAYLINLGTSWWLQNYFLNVRAAKARYGIRYVPYVHDCIPIMTPEHCVEGLTRDFITWALGAFQHADHIIVNSKATATDVKLVAGQLGHTIEEPNVVTLDADYRAANAGLPPELGSAGNTDIFLKHDIRPDEYVLFVSTIESRKNHIMAFAAWLALAKKHGLRRVPKLVCVGNRGWLNDAVYAKLNASKILQQKVTLLSRISDPDLELLYRNCLFTLYPSSYEGWGLPVTESLCFGKVPVLADGSSLPEAGGEFGEYFDLGSETALLLVLERMIFDAEYRESRERAIVERFRPRPWVAIAEHIVSLARGWALTDPPVDAGREMFSARGLWPFPVELGRYYGLTENQHSSIWRGMIAGEMFRQGDGWWWTEPWGCWTKAKVARLAFLAPLKPRSGAIVFIGVRGVQGARCTATVRLEGCAVRTVKLGPEEMRWLVFRVSKEALKRQPRSKDGTLFEFLVSADQHADFRETTKGVDQRVASIGVGGFMVCAAEDIDARLRFVESVALNDLASLLPGPDQDENEGE
jgi:glycosyltransferase involved in cell wall biosynthesis